MYDVPKIKMSGMKIVLDCGQKILEWEEWEERIATSTANFQTILAQRISRSLNNGHENPALEMNRDNKTAS